MPTLTDHLNRIRARRPYAAVADDFDVTPTTWWRWEHGQRRPSRLTDIRNLLDAGVPAALLLTDVTLLDA